MGDINLLKSPSGASDYNVTDEFTAPAGEIMTFFFLLVTAGEGRSCDALLHLHLIQVTTRGLLTIIYINAIIIRHSQRGNYEIESVS